MAPEPGLRDAGLTLQRHRRPTSEVRIGHVTIGGTRPIAVQSMTTTRTSDAQATAEQVAALARAGCDIVRVTVPSSPDADALPEIRRLLASEGVGVPLVADIHFTPRLAMRVVEHVDKVRVNPGNFSDRKSLSGATYDEQRWGRDVERAYELFAPLVDRCRKLGVAMRVGVNHGSLSDRMVYRFGDSPEGMVESALEFVRFAEDRGFHDLVISMKASIAQVMVRAYRLLAVRLDEMGSPYPLHLGVTEAGGGDEGRLKSAAGMAVLLADGLGDTVRVSLTEPPVAEVPVARELVRLFGLEPGAAERRAPGLCELRDPIDPQRRPTATIHVGEHGWGGDEVPRVELVVAPSDRRRVGEMLAARPTADAIDVRVDDADGIGKALSLLRQLPPGVGPARGVTLGRRLWHGATSAEGPRDDLLRLLSATDRVAFVVRDPVADVALTERVADSGPRALLLEVDTPLDVAVAERIAAFARELAGRGPGLAAGLAVPRRADVLGAYRVLAAALDRAGARIPMLLADAPAGPGDDPLVGTGGRLAGLLLDGIGDAVRVEAGESPGRAVALGHGVLQAAGRRLEKAEFIACPSCGRTLFDLEETTARVQALTRHLKLKIAVMGCVVNGPGEMADADFGYVGWGEDKVALFVGREVVERDIPPEQAPERLVALIKERGRWTDPDPDGAGEGTAGPA